MFEDASQTELKLAIENHHKMKSPKCNPILVIPITFLLWLLWLPAYADVVAIKYDGDGQYC